MVNKYILLFLIRLSYGTAHEFTRTSLQENLGDAIAEAAELEAAFQFDNIELVLHSILSEQRELLWTRESRKTFSVNFITSRQQKIVSEVEAESAEEAIKLGNILAKSLTEALVGTTYTLVSVLEKETQKVVWNKYKEHSEKPVEKFNPNTYWEHSERLLRKAPLKVNKE
jgi:hypothetical protein